MGCGSSNQTCVEPQCAPNPIKKPSTPPIGQQDTPTVLPTKSDQEKSNTNPNGRRVIKWRRGELIGRGAYGKVYQGLDLNSGKMIAIKTVPLVGDIKQIAADISALKQEISLLRGLDHPNIVRYLYTDISPDKRGVDILLEYMPAGSVKALLDRFGAFDEGVIRRFMRQILEGLKYLHSKGIIHRDLKCANVLVDNDSIVKLSDFGASKRISFSDSSLQKNLGASCVADDEGKELSKSLKGSPYWMAPEVVRQTGHHKAADIWSLGCVMIEMRMGRPPWSEVGETALQVLQAIAATKTGPPIQAERFSPSALAFLKRCLKVNPEERPTAEELLKDPFILAKGSGGESPPGLILDQIKDTPQKDSVKIPEKIKKPPGKCEPKQNIEGCEGNTELTHIDDKGKDNKNTGSMPKQKPKPSNTVIDRNKIVIQSEYAKAVAEIQAKERAEEERLRKEKEAKRKQWEEELRKELEAQKRAKK